MSDLVKRLQAPVDPDDPDLWAVDKNRIEAAARIKAQAARIEALEAALHEAFMAMCAYRDNKDEEVFQDAIDALGLAALVKSSN